nr:methyltransferase ausd [Quercus suber]
MKCKACLVHADANADGVDRLYNQQKKWSVLCVSVITVRDQAWDIRAYPCTGIGAWLTPQLCRLPIYAEVLKRVQDGEILADVGTFLGHDLRRLVHDGAPSENLYGIDIVSHFDVGYNFFQDREHFKGHFIEADFLSTTAPELASLRHRVDIIVISQVLHQWDWDGQLKASQVLTSFTKPGSLIVGNQIGNMQSQVFYSKIIPSGVWRHDAESFAKLWNAVGVATSTKWETQAWLRTFEEMGWYAEDSAWMEAGVCVIEFVARRIS